MSQYSILRWGVAGAGKISAHFVSAVQTDSPDKHKFVAVASKSLDSARNFSSTHRIPIAYGSYEALATDQSVQIVYIGNLNTEHYETATLFLQNGKHVLLEKPLTMNAKQTQSIISLAKEKGLFLMEAIWSRFLPAYVYAFDRIKAGDIGEVSSVDVSFGFSNLNDVDRIKQKKLGGGTILDLGVYTINLIQQAFQNDIPEQIVATGHLSEPNGVDLVVAAALKYSNNRSATLRTSSFVELLNEATIVGTKGSIRLLTPFHAADRVLINGEVKDFPLGPNTPLMNFPNSRGLRWEADAVREDLINGKLENDCLPHAHSIQIAKIQDELRRQLGVKFDADD